MTTTKVPDPLTRDEDQVEARDVVAGVHLFVSRYTPLRVTGSPGTSQAVLNIGTKYGSVVSVMVDPAVGDGRLIDLLHLEQFLVKALGQVRVHLRDQADHIELEAGQARKVEHVDTEAVAP